MNSSIRISRTAALAVVFALTMAVSAMVATAQINWSPPCGTMTVNNLDPNCVVLFTPITVPAGAIAPVVIPPGGTVVIPTPPNINLTGIVSNGGFNYFFNPPPTPPGWTCLPMDWWIGNVTLGAGPGLCCFDICLCMPACVVNLIPTTSLPPCNP